MICHQSGTESPQREPEASAAPLCNNTLRWCSLHYHLNAPVDTCNLTKVWPQQCPSPVPRHRQITRFSVEVNNKHQSSPPLSCVRLFCLTQSPSLQIQLSQETLCPNFKSNFSTRGHCLCLCNNGCIDCCHCVQRGIYGAATESFMTVITCLHSTVS